MRKLQNKFSFLLESLILIFMFSVFTSCTTFVQGNNHLVQPEKKNWTLMIYMCGDNNLSLSVFDDLNEMEAASFDPEQVNIIVLTDVSSSYVSDEFSGTKMFRVQKDSAGKNFSLVSEELNCPRLGIKKNLNRNLNTADKSVLENFILHSVEKFPAEHYGLVVWGHGNGWRGVSSNFESRSFEKINCSLTVNKAVAFDETASQFMPISNLRMAIKNSFGNNLLDFIGFDTCFGTEMEVLYELKDCGEYFSGVSGLETADGWNYDDWLSACDFANARNGKFLCNAFNEMMAAKAAINYSSVNLFEMEELFSSVDDFFSTGLSNEIWNEDVGEKILANMDLLYAEGLISDVYVGLEELCEYLCSFDLKTNGALNECCENVSSIISRIAFSSALGHCKKSIGICLCTMNEAGKVLDYSRYYVRGEKLEGQSLFVKENSSYVPTISGNESFLDLIF